MAHNRSPAPGTTKVPLILTFIRARVPTRRPSRQKLQKWASATVSVTLRLRVTQAT